MVSLASPRFTKIDISTFYDNLIVQCVATSAKKGLLELNLKKTTPKSKRLTNKIHEMTHEMIV